MKKFSSKNPKSNQKVLLNSRNYIIMRTIKHRTSNSKGTIKKTIKNRNNPDNPENDFYTYVNKDWIDKHTKSSYTTNVGKDDFSKTQIKTDKNILKKILPEIMKKKTKESIQIKNLFISLSKNNDKLAEEQINDMLKIYNFFLNKEMPQDIYFFLAWLNKNGLYSPLSINVENDIKNIKYNVFEIIESGVSIHNKGFYNDKSALNAKKIDLYHKYLNKIFARFFCDEAYDTQCIFDIEKGIINHFLREEDESKPSKTYNKYTKTKLKEECDFDLDIFTKYLGFKKTPEYVVVDNPKYLKYIITNKNWRDEKWKNYWYYQILRVFIPFHSFLYKENQEFHHAILNSTNISKSLFSLRIIENIMNTTINKYYLEHYKVKEVERKYIFNIFVELKQILKNRIKNNEWLNKNTIKRLCSKLENMTFVVGYKTKWEPDPEICFCECNAFINYIKYRNWVMNKIIEKNEVKKLPKDVWDKSEGINTYDVNSYYIPDTNEIIIPNAILIPPFFDINKGIIYNLANIGMIIGHELMHAFDNMGVEFNENAEYKKWWTDTDILVYKRKIKYLKNRYENTGKMDDIKINGDLSLGENISDIYGFLLCEELAAAKTLADGNSQSLDKSSQDGAISWDKSSPGMSQANPANFECCMKKFYYFYAKRWRTADKVNNNNKYLHIDRHSIEKYRVNNVLSMSSIFQKIYGIKKGDKMYVEIKDHLIW
jgi:putative endopeptidase